VRAANRPGSGAGMDGRGTSARHAVSCSLAPHSISAAAAACGLRTLRVSLLRRQRLGGSCSGSSTTTPAAFCPKKSAARRNQRRQGAIIGCRCSCYTAQQVGTPAGHQPHRTIILNPVDQPGLQAACCTQNQATCTRLTFEVAGRRLLRQRTVGENIEAVMRDSPARQGCRPH